ncbi:DUF1223 domain-containing protein [Roseibium polysiphoniae]|nr:DUF1223 domain-containing protein [Roseibium polysiphoniae]
MGMHIERLRKILRRTLFGAASGIVLAPMMMFSAQAGPVAVAELFTSQGCSSCPPADRLLEHLAEKGDVLALSLPVDYWDYLGWRDTLASPDNSARQRAYATRRGDRSVYTPQIVVNGVEHVVGSNARAVESALARATPLNVEVELKRNDMGIEAKVVGKLPEGVKMATVFFASVIEHEEVAVGRGENAGASITYVNVVRNLHPIGMWSGGTETFRMPKSELMRSNAERCAILIQLEDENGPGPILGAGTIDWPPAS